MPFNCTRVDALWCLQNWQKAAASSAKCESTSSRCGSRYRNYELTLFPDGAHRERHDRRGVARSVYARLDRRLRIKRDFQKIKRTHFGRLAQPVRAPALQAGGRQFDPVTAHHDNRDS